ncbi:amino acid transporter [Rhizodiscina lignyota]|uniref:Amino acid transporter n=1 Tax=Rhizodiscina lignyota TaxID=1504668 RepID=A0A9P4IC15_9PEZI|nr:amino acid transporter [Rhizodiscina lignyota]
MTSRRNISGDGTGLRQELRSWQIFAIVLTAVIGGGAFSGNGEALEIAGPAGFLTSVILMGLISIAVLDGISEFVQLFPARNALPEYTKAFVDRDLSWIVGIAYWYTFSSVFAVQNLAAANLSKYWGMSQLWQTLGFYVLIPIGVTGINLSPVSIFGWIESISGILKVFLAFGTAVLLYVIAGLAHIGNNGPVDDGFQNNNVFANNHPTAVCYAIPLVAFSYLGQEIFVVTAYEAKYSKDLRRPSQVMPYFILTLYVLLAVGEALNVRWTDPHLPQIYGGINGTVYNNITLPPPTRSMVVFATWQAGHRSLASFLNGCLIFSVLSSSNTSLYVASRTLYGLATQIPETNFIGKHLQWLKIVPFKNGVPACSVLVSALFFIWLPFLQLKGGFAVQDLQEILSTSASISCFIVWIVLCIAFIRYCRWLHLCDADIANNYPAYKRLGPTHKAYTFLGFAQPFLAYAGLIGCVLVLAFASATWWDTQPSFTKIAVAYAAPIILLPLWLIFKLIWYVREKDHGFVCIGPDVGRLIKTLRALEYKKRDERGKEESSGVDDGLGEEYPMSEASRNDDGSRDIPVLLDPSLPHGYPPFTSQPSQSTIPSQTTASGPSQTYPLPQSHLPAQPFAPPRDGRYPA